MKDDRVAKDQLKSSSTCLLQRAGEYCIINDTIEANEHAVKIKQRVFLTKIFLHPLPNFKNTN